MSSNTAMSLQQFTQALDQFLADAQSAFDLAQSHEALEEARVEFLGARQGRLKPLQKQLGAIDPASKPAAGKKLNEIKEAVQASFDAALMRLVSGTTQNRRDPLIDTTIPGRRFRLGKLHPITQTIEELKDIMGRLGFTPADGPEVEDEWHNFEALNIPAAHPARDPLENFYVTTANKMMAGLDRPDSGERLLRSQTSTVQVRVMEQTSPPVRIISLGRVYRPDTADATHYPMFHQMEGLWVDRHVTLAHLKTVLQLFATSYLGKAVPIRIRPSFFPFTEPSVEADYFWNQKWVEFGGAGIVDPNVLRAVGYDPDEYSGFAFGLGVERLCMIRHRITDIRNLFTNDVRFLRQF